MAVFATSSSQKHRNLNALFSKENISKVTRRNILCPAPEEWPRPSAALEEEILKKLTEKFKGFVSVIIKSAKKCSVEDQEEKARIRSQLKIGVSSVFRALEQDILACILVSGQATPAVSVNHIISLGRERGCPVLCLDQLAPTIARVTESKWLPLAIGFKKMDSDSQSDFEEIVSLVVESVTVHASHLAYLSTNQHLVPKEDVSRTSKNGLLLRIDMTVGKKILGDLKRVFTKMLAVDADREKDVKTKKKQRKKNLKSSFDKAYHSQFEIGKRTVTEILKKGKLQLVLVSEEILPVLLFEDLSNSLLSIAALKRCPVIVMPGLLDTMRAVCAWNVSVLGFKKVTFCRGAGHTNFELLIEKCIHAITRPNGELSQECKEVNTQSTLVKMDHDSLKGTKVPAAADGSSNNNKASMMADKDTSDDRINKGITDSDKNTEEEYSHMYILKKNSKELAQMRDELSAEANISAKDEFSEDFISLSGNSKQQKLQNQNASQRLKIDVTELGGSVHFKPKHSMSHSAEVESSADLKDKHIALIVPAPADSHNLGIFSNMGANIVNSSSKYQSSVPPLFSLCRSGDPHTWRNISKPCSQKEAKVSPINQEDKFVLGVQELPQLEDIKAENDFIALDETAVKRKLQTDSFISFAYTEANIQTMVSDMSKKRKKKKIK